ncbi:MAG: hypothetical protein IKU09_05230 [Firmicutes bacterium]|nr:hypothetical protein [Bacillota bacterium]
MRQISMKRGMLAVLTVLCVLLLCMICTESADAAAKYERGELGSVEERTEIGGKYFYSDSILDDEAWVSYTCIYVSNTPDGKGKRIAKLNDMNAYPDRWILSNGSKVYYSYMETDTGKYKIYRVDVDGKNRKRIKTLSPKGDWTLSLSSIYNSKLYYVWGNGYWGSGSLYTITLKDGYKVTRRHKDFSPYAGYASGGSRYLYGFSDSKQGLRVYDCKTDKIIRTIPGIISEVEVKKGKLCYLVQDVEKGTLKFYAASLSGKTKTLLLEVDSDCMFGQFDPESVYYYDTDGVPYRYDVESKEHVKITDDEFLWNL